MKRRNFIKTVAVSGLLTIPLFARGRQRSTTPTITEVHKNELLYIYQEEKVARDVYITLGKLYPGEGTFASIQLSEQRHIDAVQGLCEKYRVDISKVNELQVGNFVIPELQDAYDTFISLGKETLIDALQVGKEIEMMDIIDLDKAMTMFIGFNDVQNVFGNLKEGSLNHLDAFNNAITRLV